MKFKFNLGVIGIKDCEAGGERVVFSSVSRDQVDNVTAIVKSFSSHPDRIQSSINNCKPLVVDEPTAGVLCLFNGALQCPCKRISLPISQSYVNISFALRHR